jgi:O-antigen/teichoic acid export membrane protein
VRSGFAWASVFNVLVKGIGIATGVLAARLLGPEGRGDLAAVMTVISIAALVGSLGLDQAVALEVGTRRRREGSATRSGLALAVAWGTVFTGALYLIAPLLLPDDDLDLVPDVRLVLISLVPLFIGYVLLAVDQGAFRFARRGVLASLQPAGYLVLMMVAWALGDATVRGFTVAYVAAQGVAMLVRLWVHRAHLVPPRSVDSLPDPDEDDRVPAMVLVVNGARLHLPHLATLAIQKLDMVLVVLILDPTQTGLYAVAFAIAFGQNALIEAFSRVSFARVAGIARPGERVDEILAHARIAQVVTVAVTAGVLLISPLVVRWVFGGEFVPATAATMWLVLAWGVLGLAMSIDMSLRGANRVRPGVVAFGLGSVVLLLGGLWLVPSADSGIETMAKVLLAAAALSLVSLLSTLARLPGARWRDLWGLRPGTLAGIRRGGGER